MWPCQWIAGILENVFIELSIFWLADLGLVFEPKWFVFIKSFELVVPRLFGSCSVDCIFDIVISELLAFLLPLFSESCVLIFELLIRLFDFLFVKVFLSQVNWVVDKWTVFLDKFFKLLVSAVLCGILFEEKSDKSSSLKLNWIILFNSVWIGGGTGPLMLNIIVVLGNDLNFWGDEEGWIKSYTELADQVDITGLKVLKEVGGAWLGYSA